MDNPRKKVEPFVWKKHGLVFRPNSDKYWQNSHAALPTKLHLGGSYYRLYFTSRDIDNKTYIGFFEIDLEDTSKITRQSSSPLLSPGPLGFFDDHGVQACSVVQNGKDLYLYYLGWNLGSPSPLFYTSIGLAISKDGGETFEKYSSSPIMQRSEFDPWMVSGGTVIKGEEGFVMYYLSGFKFDITSNGVVSYYDIKVAYSADGINWNRKGEIAFPLNQNETNISRITIEKIGREFYAFYPYKVIGESYKMGFAISKDGINWERKDDLAGLSCSSTGWDSQAIDKMELISYNNKLYLLYNGNKYGYDGIGLATCNL